MSTKTYITTLRLILNEITARAQRDYGSCPTRLRLVISMLLMFTLGTTTAWAVDDFSGIWYIANNANHDNATIDTHWYLVPGADPKQQHYADAYFSDEYCSQSGKGDYKTTYGDPEKPFLTTFQTSQDFNSIWVVVSTGDGYYNIIHFKTGKYIVYEPPYLDAPNRKSVHLESTTTPGDNAKFDITGSLTGPINIRPVSIESGNRFFNPAVAQGNYDRYYGTGDYLHTGMIGLYSGSDGNSQWYFEDALFSEPTISVNVESRTFSITTPTPDFSSVSGYSIRYTIGDGTQDAPTPTTTGYTGYVYTKDEAVKIGNFTKVKAVIVGHGMVLSEVADVDVKCDIPSLTSYDATNHRVVFKTTTTGATIYYTSTTDGSDPADPTTSNNSGYGSSPLTINDVNSTTKFKAIAVKDGLVSSDVNSQIMVIDPTITLSSYSFAYTGLEIEPTVSINGGNVGDIPDTEYDVSYENNKDAGTATATVTNKSGGNYYVIGGSVNFVITQVPLTITSKNHTITYGDAPDNNGVTYAGFVEDEDESDLTGTLVYAYNYSQYGNVGTYADAITPGGLTSDNYDITFNSGTLTVVQKEVGLTWGTTELTYSGVSQVPTVTAAGTVNGDKIGVTVTGGQTAVGSGYTATASALTGDKAGNYKLPAANTKEFSIGKAPLTVTAKNHTIIYGEAPAANGVKYSGFVNGENESVLTGTPKYYFDYAQYDNVGDNYTITPYDLAATNYAITFVPGTLTVAKKEVGLSWEKELTYSGVNQVPTATATGTVNGDEIGVTVTGGQTNIGSDYTATATELTGTKAGNYKLPTANTTEFSIGKATLTVTANNHTITYGAAPANGGVTYTGFVNDEDESDLTGTLGYAYNYSQYGDVGTGTYTITPSGLSSSNYDITYENGTLTVTPKEVRIEWGETYLTYNGSGQVPTATIKSRDDDIVNIDNDNDKVNNVVTVTASAKEGSALTEDGDAVNPGYYRATASFTGTKAGNYKPAPSSQSFKISGKTIGDGNEPAEGIDILLTQEGSNVVVAYVKDGGTTLNPNDDYTVDTEIQGFDTYITITGKGNYGGSVRKLFVKPEFFKPTGASEYAAVYRASSDLSKPTGITPYIVKKVNPSMGTINIASVGYLPKDVPVLMLADENISGFIASSKPDNVTAITAQTENSNLLKVAPEGGVSVKDAQVYMFYKGEFVLAKKGKITEGKFYLDNPNYSATSHPAGSAGSRSVLRFVVGDSTGIVDVEKSEDSGTASGHDAWYLLDGRRLSGKPNKQGLYIWNGRKTVIKKK